MTTTVTLETTYLDQFTAHLAVQLLDKERVLAWLQGLIAHPATRSPSLPTSTKSPSSLYWRSKLLVEDPTAKTKSTGARKSNNRLWFVDIVFDIIVAKRVDDDHGNNQKVELSARFGYFFLEEEPPTPTDGETDTKGMYVQSAPLTMTQLEYHATAIGIDLHSASPKAMARMTAQALEELEHQQGSSSLATLEKCKLVDKPSPNNQQAANKDIHLSLYYHDLGEACPLVLTVSETTSGFDSLGMSVLYRALLHDPKRSHPNDSTTEPIEDGVLTQRLQKALQAFLLATPELDCIRAKDSPNGSGSTTGTKHVTSTSVNIKPGDEVTNAINSKKRNSVQHSYAKVSTKRKKKGKIVYAKPD